MLARRERAASGSFRATSVKLMVDGVCETFTAAMSAPYLDGHGHSTDHSGNFFIEPDELTAIASLMAGHGFQLHFHALGDAAVTAALDAVEALPAGRRAAGRHHLAHLQFIKPSDIGRFARLGAVANFQPLGTADGGADDPVRRPGAGSVAVPDRRRRPRRRPARVRQRLAGVQR
jgi:hypothetical protein